jgi:hypothetical protein
MTGNLQAIGFLITWVLLWCLGGVALESVLESSGLITPSGAGLAGGLGFLLWTAAISLGGWALFNRITGVSQAGPRRQENAWSTIPQPLQRWLERQPALPKGQRRLVVLLSQLGDFDSVEYAQALMQQWQELQDAGIDVRAVGIGDAGSAERFCRYTSFPRERLSLEPEAALHRELGLYSGVEGFGGPWGNLMAMCAGIGSPGTLREVLRGYHGGGRFLPFWIASIRLRNMIEVLSHWGTYVPDERWMTQRGATLLINERSELLYSWRDRGLLGFSATMAEPLAFLKLHTTKA